MLFYTVLCVGGTALLGTALGFLFRNLPRTYRLAVPHFASGVMLAAAILGLILPSLECGNEIVTVAGMFFGALLLDRLERRQIRLCNRLTLEKKQAILFALAILLHKFPEGCAAGVGIGTDKRSGNWLIVGGIMLQNVPESMILVSPMLSAGFGKWKTFQLGLATAVLEMAGTVVGFFAVRLMAFLLPVLLSVAGGTMLYVTVGETMRGQTEKKPSDIYIFLFGFAVILLSDAFLSG